MNTDDHVLWSLIVTQNDEKAFDMLFVKYYPGLLHYSQLLLPYPADEAEDIITDVFFKIWEQRGNLIIHTSIASYLYSAVKNKVYDYHRKRKGNSFQSLEGILDDADDAYNRPDQQLSYKELHAEIDRLIARLPKRSQLVFRMNRHDHLSYEEIATILNLSINSVKTHMYRAIKFLKEEYKASDTIG